ncbi:MBL fold metallo-hydrolase [Catellatospora sp. TT07R-123]|uniref:MBL fold metallo-hydrolase n=1 Tax=Catellatospora sp. TT07R-123 TaxID=2733863 RepID=UPI001B16E81B|nr:MBL fold metallo-hydrolase [Catellatospora sp. TT07R-123]GHJ44777.1 MBL fold metallo-hydrolase [Catellatospora sp. TT07R-123]
MTEFTEVADGVFVLVYPTLRVNCTLITGETGALLVDTLSTGGQARELAAAAARITAKPLGLVNTHFHFDHCLGNATLAGAATPIWGHTECVRELRDNGAAWQRAWEQELLAEDEPLAREVGRTPIVPPNRPVGRRDVVDVGGRTVVLDWHGRGHTAGDLVVTTGSVVVAGDLVEEGAPPAFGDAFPLEWPETLASLARAVPADALIVPGHGELVDPEFLGIAHEELAALDWLIREAHGDGADVAKVAAASSLARWGGPGLREAELAVRRGYAQLDAATANTLG